MHNLAMPPAVAFCQALKVELISGRDPVVGFAAFVQKTDARKRHMMANHRDAVAMHHVEYLYSGLRRLLFVIVNCDMPFRPLR